MWKTVYIIDKGKSEWTLRLIPRKGERFCKDNKYYVVLDVVYNYDVKEIQIFAS